MKLTIRAVRATERRVQLRVPFSYGDVRVTEMPEAQLELVAETANGTVVGRSAQIMAPRWFNKSDGLTPAASVEELRRSVKCAVENALGQTGSAASIATHIRAAAVEELGCKGVPLLAAGYGAALVEAALIDACCRAVGTTFPAAAQADVFGLAEMAPADLGKAKLKQFLENITEPWTLSVRHTVGFRSPLTQGEVPKDFPDDGLPVSLAGAVAQTGVHWFKIKLKGQVDDDLDWLRSVDAVIAEQMPRFGATVDANEQYEPEALAELLGQVEADGSLRRLRNAIAFIEQPFPREVALSDTCTLPKTDIPLVIDESDDSDDALIRAFERGWSGTSAKSCKGVFHALTNAARVADRRSRGENVIITAEDLSCQAFLALQQDTLMAMAVGATHVERNGHQFGGPLQGYPQEVSASVLDRHSDIYRAVGGRPCLRVEGGRMRFASLNVAGFGSIDGVGIVGKPLA